MFLSKENVVYAFGPTMQPISTAQPGDLVVFETVDALGGQIKLETDTLQGLDFSKVNPATGPLAISGAAKGDALRLDILEIKVATSGVILAVPGLGVLGDQVKEPQTKIVPIEAGSFNFNGLKLPLNPMIGVVGVAPEEDTIPCGTPGNHGGNMDTRDICTGSTLYLPVFQEGAQLAMGDVHAAMGDGEICGTGVECSAEVLVRVSLQKDMKLKRPLLITSTEVQAIASAETADEAAKLAIGDLVSYIMKQNRLSFNDAYMLASVMGNARISQLVDPLITVRMGIAKELISF